ncbi:2033_t:CDS:1 [Ambispora gerdemannii]|uniref:2033_t:CDS:1 n=1 Tax=Ambispora gerdemannii TaxID=144530 RepID=A0A9N8V9J5_9GLOM|nr:2033_t:CDS:1 [Ambispora gerdemannii]
MQLITCWIGCVTYVRMSLSLDINMIFIDEVDMDISNNELDDTLDCILDVTDGVDQEWKTVEDDNIVQNGSLEIEKTKTYYFLIKEYTKWIKNLEKAGLCYI